MEAARIGGNLGEDMFQRDIAAGDGCGIGNIEGTGTGRGGAGEIQHHGVAADGEVECNGEALVDNAVIVEKILEVIDAVRQGGDAGAHHGFGTGCKGLKTRLTVSSP